MNYIKAFIISLKECFEEISLYRKYKRINHCTKGDLTIFLEHLKIKTNHRLCVLNNKKSQEK